MYLLIHLARIFYFNQAAGLPSIELATGNDSRFQGLAHRCQKFGRRKGLSENLVPLKRRAKTAPCAPSYSRS